MNTMEDLQDALNTIGRMSASKCYGLSDRKRLLTQIENVANIALDSLILSPDEKQTIIGLRIGTCKVVL